MARPAQQLSIPRNRLLAALPPELLSSLLPKLSLLLSVRQVRHVPEALRDALNQTPTKNAVKAA
jgi:hypothetical protein